MLRYTMLCVHAHDSLPLGPQGARLCGGSRLIVMNRTPPGEACAAVLPRSMMPRGVLRLRDATTIICTFIRREEREVPLQ